MSSPADLFDEVRSILPDERTALNAAWTTRKVVQRNQALVEIGDVDKHLWFVLEGSFVIVFENHHTSSCVGLGYPGTLLSSFPSFLAQKPSKFRIVALKKSSVLGIKHADFQGLLQSSVNIHLGWRMLLEQAVIGLIDREVEYLNTTPAERVRSLFTRNPKVFQLYPQKYLASYLKIDQATLSRLKTSIIL